MNERADHGSRTRLRVRYAETDQMGRAHHSHYLAWFEMGRTELMRTHGVSYAEMEEAGVLLPVARVEVEYRNGVGYDEPVEIRTRVEEVRSRSVTFAYEALDVHGDTTLARGRTVLVCTGSDGRPRRIPERAVAVLRQLRDASRE